MSVHQSDFHVHACRSPSATTHAFPKPGMVMSGVGDPDPLVPGYVNLLQHDSTDAPVVDDLLDTGQSKSFMLHHVANPMLLRCFAPLARLHEVWKSQQRRSAKDARR